MDLLLLFLLLSKISEFWFVFLNMTHDYIIHPLDQTEISELLNEYMYFCILKSSAALHKNARNFSALF